MKILYISPEHVSGTLSLFKAEHERRGDECRFVTFWHSRWDFPDDICLHLPLMPDRGWVRALRIIKLLRQNGDSQSSKTGIPYWNPGRFEALLFRWRDKVLWPRIKQAVAEHKLSEFDIIHFDGGLDFTRDGRFARKMAETGKNIACFYHGSDLRNRGVIRSLDDIVTMRLTCEWDLLEFDPRLRYLYLPCNTSGFPNRDYGFHKPIRICHASRNPYKGTAFLEAAVKRLAAKHSVELFVLRNVPHREAVAIKQECDIFVDQLTNAGGWGYGMSSVEALAMGMPVVTNIPPQMRSHLGDHPFVHASVNDVSDVLDNLMCDERKCRDLSAAGREWVRLRHDIRAVGDQLYTYYREAQWIPAN
jgi:glycosyltransferase involved in cell wall biosynthesis